MTHTPPDVRPPIAPVDPKVTKIHGDELVDPYHWLRQRDSTEVVAYLEAENQYTEALMGHTAELRRQLYEEILGRIKETDLSVPTRRGDYFYYSRTEEKLQYRIHCRKQGSLEAPEVVILDVNALAEGHEFFRVGSIAPSPDHRLLAYSVDTVGSEEFTLRVKDLRTGRLLGDEIANIAYSVAWGNDNKTLFYTTRDHAKRPFKVHRHVLGTDPEDDVVLLHETDEAFAVYIEKTRSKQYLTILCGSNITTEVSYLDADSPHGEFTILRPRRNGVEYYLGHHDEYFYIRTNDGAKNFTLMRTPVAATAKENWEEVLPHRNDVKLETAQLFRGHLVVFERRAGIRKVRVRDLATGEDHHVAFPESVYSVEVSSNPEFDTEVFRLEYTSLITPRSVYDYHMHDRTRELLKQIEVVGGYDASLYFSERTYARAPDGTAVPISLVYRKGLDRDGGNPCLLTGYGAYGANIDPAFRSHRLSLLDRGFVFAIAHVRGGSTLGEEWRDQGKMLHKRNTFTDFIAAAEHVIDQGYTSSDRLAVQGGSAGGLLLGAVLNMRPELFEVAIAQVPFVDVLNTMLDAGIPLTVIEYEEWGNPADEEYYRYIRSYSPYENVTAHEYPHMLITAGLNDSRVQYWEPAKWTARLRTLKTDDHRLLLKTNMGAGHAGMSGRYDALKEMAFEWAFLFDSLGIEF
ncbi:MAG: S9 family peptidase [bacterium]|nr:S9 family peptidase [bacterium]